MAVCDWESRFVKNFLDYYMIKSSDVMDIKVFTEVAGLIAYGKDRKIDVLLISDSYMGDDVEELGAEKIILLSEGGVSKKYADYPIIYKYQSSERIISQIMNIYADCVHEDTSYCYPGRSLRIIGVYSPDRRTGKTSMALALGQLLAKDKKVLYLNMEEYSGLGRVLEGSYKGDLLDAIFISGRKTETCVTSYRG